MSTTSTSRRIKKLNRRLTRLRSELSYLQAALDKYLAGPDQNLSRAVAAYRDEVASEIVSLEDELALLTRSS